MLNPSVVFVGVGDGVLFLLVVCPWAGSLTMVGVFNWTRETVVMSLSEPARRMDVLFCAGSVTALRFNESGVRIT